MNRNAASKLVKRLGAQADARGIESLSEHQRNVLVPYWARGVIGNGGFEYFFEGSYDLVDVARRFRALGLTDVAGACEQVAGAVFGAALPLPQGREAILARVDWSAFREQERVVYGLSWEALQDAIAAYVSSHPEAARATA